MKVTRVVTLTREEQAHLDYLQAVADSERTFRHLRREAMRRAVALGLPTRMVGDACGMSAAEVSRVATGLRT